MILVNAANGNQGKILVPKLVAAGLKVRACVRSERSALELNSSGVADVVIGDLADKAFARQALIGVEKVYHVCPGIHPLEKEIGFSWIDAARTAGVEHFVFSSVLHAVLTDLVQHEIKRDIEEHLISSGLEFTILQPTIYMAPKRLKLAFETGVLKAGWSLDRRQSLVNIGDVADAVVQVLLHSDANSGATYELVGPGRFTAHEMGAVISRVVGRQIQVEEIDADTYLKSLFGDKALLAHESRVGRSLTARYSSHEFIGNPNVLTWLLGRPPTTFEQFVSDQYALFNNSSAGPSLG